MPVLNSTPACVSPSNSHRPVNTSNGALFKFSDKFTWEKYSSGVASKILDKMGYSGKGLGKDEDGILEPVTIKPAAARKNSRKRKSIFILSDSMLNGLKEKRLSCKNADVKISCHGGCTLKCAYTHIEPILEHKPDIVLVHIGTNDCSEKTSDEVLNDITNFKKHIEQLLPATVVYISLPTIRRDKARANVIIRNLNTKLKRKSFNILDNHNIGEGHLGRKGLHLNSQGVKMMASNIISFIKRL